MTDIGTAYAELNRRLEEGDRILSIDAVSLEEIPEIRNNLTGKLLKIQEDLFDLKEREYQLREQAYGAQLTELLKERPADEETKSSLIWFVSDSHKVELFVAESQVEVSSIDGELTTAFNFFFSHEAIQFTELILKASLYIC